MIKCICIDNDNRPSRVPETKWLEKGKEYTLAFSMTVHPQKKLAFQVQEIELDDSCSPYTWFLANRFAFRKEDTDKLIEFIKECNQITFSVNELMKVTNVDEREQNTIEKN
jgi:triphosphoribosyl-dephospho-CoA synthetase